MNANKMSQLAQVTQFYMLYY